MAKAVYINVADAADGAAVSRALARSGLIAGLVRRDGRWQLEIAARDVDARTLLVEIGAAVAASTAHGRSRPQERAA